MADEMNMGTYENEDTVSSTPHTVISIVDGAKIKQCVEMEWLKKFGFEKSAVNDVTIQVNGDFSGWDDQSAGIELTDGTRVPISNQMILRAITSLTPVVSSKFQPVAWSIAGEPDSDELIDVDSQETCVIHMQDGFSIEDTKENSYAKLKALLTALDEFDFVEKDAYLLTDNLFKKGGVAYKLLSNILSQQGFDQVESLIYRDADVSSRNAFNVARFFANFVIRNEEVLPIDVADIPLVKRLLNERRPLNDFWKDRLRIVTT
jgi:hypothetical protein